MTFPCRRSTSSPLSAAAWLPWAVGVTCLAPFAPLLVPGESVLPTYAWSDYTTFQLPVHEFARNELLGGRIPLWMPWLGNGTPLHAGQQAGLFYPGLTFPLLILPANTAFTLSMFGHLALAFAGQSAAGRALGARRAGACLAAASLTQSGFVVNHMMAGHVGIVIGASLIPWFLWAIVRLLREPGPGGAAVTASVGAALVLGSHAQIAYYAALLAALWTLGASTRSQCWGARRRQLAWAAAAGALAVVAGAVQWIPTLELARDGLAESPRGDASFASTYAMTTLDWVRMIVPDVTGNPMLGKPAAHHTDLFHERVTYLGLLCPILAVYGLARARVRRWQLGAAALAATGMMTALGDATPWFGVIGHIVPGWYSFRCAGRVFAVVTPLVGLLAARGLDALLAREPAGLRGRWWLVPLALWGAGNLTILPEARIGEPTPVAALAHAWSHAPAELITAVAFLGAAAATLALAGQYGRRSPTIAAGVVLAFALADLGYHNAANFRMADEPGAVLPAELLDIDPPVRFAEAPGYPRLSLIELTYGRMVRAAVEGRRSMVGTNEGGVLPGALSRYYRAVERDAALGLALAGCSRTCDGGGARWRTVPGALPRARLATGRAAALCGVDIEQLTHDDVATLRAGSWAVRIAAEKPRRIQFDVDAPGDVMLVLADTYYPGWNCAVDGHDAPIETAHGVFRAVRVPAGPHRVEMAYEPRSFLFGAALSVAGIAIVLVLACVARRQAALRQGRQADGALTMRCGE